MLRRGPVLVLMILAAVAPLFAAPAETGRPLVIGYVFPQAGPLRAEQIDAHQLTRINYAFGVLRAGRAVVPTEDDKANLRVLAGIARRNPPLTVLISIGGWLGSGGFSDAALTKQSRAVFVASALEIVRQFDLDGVDIDWEYPDDPGAGNKFRKEDKQNFTLLLKDLRAALTKESAARHKRLYLSIATGVTADYLAHTEMAKVQSYVDTVNLMSYDYYEPGTDPLTGNHAPLYSDPADPKKDSTDTSVKAFASAGVPPEKILLGVPFYGHIWKMVPNVQHGLFQPGKAPANGYVDYGAIQSNLLGHGYTRFWDAASKVPYLYNESTQTFVSYEDAESLAAKCNYVLEHKLGGIMFWNYLNDPSGELLGTIDRSFQHAAGK